jgi:hypothetical protein
MRCVCCSFYFISMTCSMLSCLFLFKFSLFFLLSIKIKNRKQYTINQGVKQRSKERTEKNTFFINKIQNFSTNEQKGKKEKNEQSVSCCLFIIWKPQLKKKTMEEEEGSEQPLVQINEQFVSRLFEFSWEAVSCTRRNCDNNSSDE